MCTTDYPLPPPPQARAMEIATGHWKAQALRAFIEAGLPDIFKNNVEMSANAVAQAAGLHPEATFRLLRYLATFDVVICCEQQQQD